MSKEQIEEMKNEVCICCSKLMDCHEHLKGICGFMKMIEMLYDIGYRKQSDWISVDERLPDADCPVLIFTKKNRYYVGYYYKAVVDEQYTGFYSDSIKRDVTHWMPLPEAPKMKGGAE